VCLFAPSRAYGRPDDFRALVDEAHRLGIAVLLDVVYNHLGPDGAYLTQFNPHYLTNRHSTPWGRAINLDGPGSEVVRRFIIDNAVHWVREYHLDGLRLDATHALIDESQTHIVAELADATRQVAGRPIAIHAEDHRNLAALLQPRAEGGWGLDGVWADDFHHVVRRLIAGDAHGYYEDFHGTADELARTIHQGWLFTGQRSRHRNKPWGTDPSRVPMKRFVICLQNHDQVGNRALGDRLHHSIDRASWRAASTVLLMAPMTPLLFMGQEWAASTPFQFFTDLEPRLGRAVTEGRRREFKDFPEFADGSAHERIPDPQARSTFEASVLRWDERHAPEHAATLALYTALLALRGSRAALGASEELTAQAWPGDGESLVFKRVGGGDTFWIVARLRGSGAVRFGNADDTPAGSTLVLSTEESRFAPDPQPPRVRGAAVEFQRPGAVVLKAS
jgi:maltooligosyltrehalose trehalohydrolase